MKSDAIVAEVNKVLARYDTPLTLRQVYYQLVAALIIPNNINSYKYLGKILVKAREDGKVNPNRIEDRGRITIGGDYAFYTPDEYYEGKKTDFRNASESYHRPRWYGQEKYLEVWVEKDALSRLVSTVADGLCVTTCVAKGYSSFSFVQRAADRIRNACLFSHDDVEYKQPVILYFGDFDPSGEDMVRDLGARLMRYGLDTWVGNLDEDVEDQDALVSKLALTQEQITKYKLPPAPVKMSDVRAIKFVAIHGTDVVELDALDPKLLQSFVRDGIIEHINQKTWQDNINLEKEEQTEMKERIDAHFKER